MHGGRGSVRLYHKGEVVRETRARNSNDSEIPLRGFLHNLKGEVVTLSIDDDIDGDWGFISVSPFELR